MAKLASFLLMCVCVAAIGCDSDRPISPVKKSKSKPKTGAVEVVTDSSSDAVTSRDSSDVEGDAGIATDDQVSVKSYVDSAESPDPAKVPAESEIVAKDELPPKETVPAKVKEREGLLLTTVKKRKNDVRAFVIVGKEPAKELLWPKDEKATSTNDGICFKGETTEIVFKIYSDDSGDLYPGSEEVGVLETLPDTLIIGCEEGGCDDDKCQNDNILSIRCAGGLKLVAPK